MQSRAGIGRVFAIAVAGNREHGGQSPISAEPNKDWSLTSLTEKLIKIGAKVIRHGRYVASQMADVVIPQQMFREKLRLITDLRPQPPPKPA
jgi:hypothetical protein